MIKLSVVAKCAICMDETVNVKIKLAIIPVILLNTFFPSKNITKIVRVEKKAEKVLPIWFICPQSEVQTLV